MAFTETVADERVISRAAWIVATSLFAALLDEDILTIEQAEKMSAGAKSVARRQEPRWMAEALVQIMETNLDVMIERRRTRGPAR